MKSSDPQLRRALAAAKRDLRRRHREDKTMRRRLVDLNDALGALLGDDSVAPSRRDYSTTKSTSGLLSDLERKQYLLSWKKFRKILQGKPADKQAETLFDRAESEFARIHGKLPGREYLIRYACHQVQKLGLPRKTVFSLTDARATKYLNQRKRLFDDGDMTVEKYIYLCTLDDAGSPTLDN